MALGSTQSLTELRTMMRTMNLPGGGVKGAGQRLMLTSPPSVSGFSSECGSLDFSHSIGFNILRDSFAFLHVVV
jgi:hypothetical protein